MSEDLSLSYKVENTMFDVLKDIWGSVRTMEVYITLLLTYECLVSV